MLLQHERAEYGYQYDLEVTDDCQQTNVASKSLCPDARQRSYRPHCP